MVAGAAAEEAICALASAGDDFVYVQGLGVSPRAFGEGRLAVPPESLQIMLVSPEGMYAFLDRHGRPVALQLLAEKLVKVVQFSSGFAGHGSGSCSLG